MSQAGNFISTVLPPGTTVQTLSGNTGGPVGPDGTNNINVIGDGVTISIAGNPGTHTLTASLIGGGGGGATLFPTDSGIAIESGGVLNIIAGTSSLSCGSSVAFFGASDIVQLHVTDVNNNTMIGSLAGSLTIGTTNIGLGYGAGDAYTSAESNNIVIGNHGIASEDNVIRLGTMGSGAGEQNKCFIAGIDGITPDTADGIPVFIGSAGQLGTVGSGGSTFVSTLTGSTSGGAISPLAGNINITAGTGITVVGTAHTLTISATGAGSGITSITGDTGGAQSGPPITLAGGTTGASFGGSANTITMTFAGITANGGTVSLATDATTSTVNIGTGAGAKTVTVGSTNTTSALTLNSGTGFITATGVFGVTSASSVPLFINSSGKLGTAGGSGGTTFVQTLTGSTSGGAISPLAGNININAGTGITVVGTANTLTINATNAGTLTSITGDTGGNNLDQQ